MEGLKNKTYIITGASSGIGKNIAEYLTQEMQANVVLIARRYEIIKKMAEELPGENYAFSFDFNQSDKVGSIFNYLKENNILVDGMVYAAGIAPLFKLEENEYDAMMQTMHVNALSFAEMGKYMLQGQCTVEHAAIVAVSSIVSLVTSNRQSAYAASKTMLNTYVKYLAKEALGRMRVNAVLPGAVETELYDKLKSESFEFEEKIKRNYPLGVIPKEQVSKLVAFLLSQDAEYITGALYTIDSGYMLR